VSRRVRLRKQCVSVMNRARRCRRRQEILYGNESWLEQSGARKTVKGIVVDKSWELHECRVQVCVRLR